MAAEAGHLKARLEAWNVTREGRVPGIEAPAGWCCSLTPLFVSRAAITPAIPLVRCPVTGDSQYSVLCIESTGKVTKEVQILLGERCELVVCTVPSIPLAQLPIVGPAPKKSKRGISRCSGEAVLTVNDLF